MLHSYLILCNMTDGEKIASIEAKMEGIDRRLNSIDDNMKQLNAKFDLITSSYVHKDTFDEYKKNKWLERVIVVLVTAILSGLVAFFLHEAGV